MTPPQYDLLAESAPLAWRIAPQTCRRDPQSGESCAWSHRIWQYLRLLRLITTPDDQHAFYGEALAPYAGLGRPPRILVSGAADYGMLAEVLEALRPRGVEPQVVVADICETPLVVNRWYAERAGCTIATVCSDILELSDAGGFDAICTHSFFGRFHPSRRPLLIESWRRLLRPGGAVISVNRLRPDAAAATGSRFAAGDDARLGELVLRAAAARPLGVDPQALAREAQAYAGHTGGHPLRSREELEALFEGGGMRLEHFSAAPVTREAPAPRGPTMPGGALYASFIARART